MWDSWRDATSELLCKTEGWPAAVVSKGLATALTGSVLTAAGKSPVCPEVLLTCVSRGAAAFGDLLLDVHHDRGCSSGMVGRAGRAGTGRHRRGSRPLATQLFGGGRGACSTGSCALGSSVGMPALRLRISIK